MLRTAILALSPILLAGCLMTAVGVGVLVDTQIKDGIGIQDFAAGDQCGLPLDGEEPFDLGHVVSYRASPSASSMARGNDSLPMASRPRLRCSCLAVP